MRSAARRNETCTYSLTVEIGGGHAGSAAPKPAESAGGSPVVSRGSMAAHCRGEASSLYGVKPAYIMTKQIADAAGRFLEVAPLDSDGE